jgi:hypothetical protein
MNVAVASGATADGVGGPAVAQDVDTSGNPIIQSVAIQGIPSNRVGGSAGGMHGWGVAVSAMYAPARRKCSARVVHAGWYYSDAAGTVLL